MSVRLRSKAPIPPTLRWAPPAHEAAGGHGLTNITSILKINKVK